MAEHVLDRGFRDAVAFIIGEDVPQKAAPPAPRIADKKADEDRNGDFTMRIWVGAGPIETLPKREGWATWGLERTKYDPPGD